MPPGRPWHRELEEISGTANDGASLTRCHGDIEGTYPYYPFLVTNDGEFGIDLNPEKIVLNLLSFKTNKWKENSGNLA